MHRWRRVVTHQYMRQGSGADRQAKNECDTVDPLVILLLLGFSGEGVGVMCRLPAALDGREHGRLPARLGLFRIMRQFATLALQRHDVTHLHITGLELIDLRGYLLALVVERLRQLHDLLGVEVGPLTE